MASIDFPGSPSNNDTFTSGNVTYVYNGVKGVWLVSNSAVRISTSSVVEGDNLYFTDSRVAAALFSERTVVVDSNGLLTANVTSDDVAEGSTNLFFTNDRAYSNTVAGNFATKTYVDEVAAGIQSKPSVKAATTEALDTIYDNGTDGVGATLTSANNISLTTLAIDGVVAYSIYDGILVKNQSNSAENGRYVVANVGSDDEYPYVLLRCYLCDQSNEIPGAYMFVTGGNVNGGTGWTLIVDDPSTYTVGTDSINVYQFTGVGTYTAGDGIDLTGTEFSVNTNYTINTFTAGDNMTIDSNGLITATVSSGGINTGKAIAMTIVFG